MMESWVGPGTEARYGMDVIIKIPYNF